MQIYNILGMTEIHVTPNICLGLRNREMGSRKGLPEGKHKKSKPLVWYERLAFCLASTHAGRRRKRLRETVKVLILHDFLLGDLSALGYTHKIHARGQPAYRYLHFVVASI